MRKLPSSCLFRAKPMKRRPRALVHFGHAPQALHLGGFMANQEQQNENRNQNTMRQQPQQQEQMRDKKNAKQDNNRDDQKFQGGGMPQETKAKKQDQASRH
ncbi:MAG: hypothetical protein JO346_08500 [Alphaproteobacteria bacterium]|nr:hypothetical protein [Alphaproteobacteria bacterium]